MMQPPAAIAAYVTSEKHPTTIRWVRGVAEGGHEMSQLENTSCKEELGCSQPTLSHEK